MTMSLIHDDTFRTHPECQCDTDQAEGCPHYCHQCGTVRHNDDWTDEECRPLCFACANPMEVLEL